MNSPIGGYIGEGVYRISNGSLDASSQYRLSILLEGKEYVSEYLSPIYTPEIDSISWIKREKGDPISICVSTHDPNNQSDYYRWKYKEQWEVKAELFASVGLVMNEDFTQDLVLYDISSSNNIYYCWGVDSSKVLLLGNSEKLSGNIISQHKLQDIPSSDDKVSILYYIEVTQNQIRKAAYDYFYNLQKNIEQTGGLFSSMPTEMKGNIRNVADPEENIIGYIDVSTTTYKKHFIESSEYLYEPLRNNCKNEITDDPSQGKPLFQLADPSYFYAPRPCFDCRTRKNASKNRPSFWPTDHY